MIFDGELKLSDAQAITGDAISENVYDRGGAAADAIGGEDLWVVMFVGGADFDNLTSLQVTIESDSTADLATSATVHVDKTILLAALTANTKHIIGKLGNLSKATPSERYIGARYNVNGTDPSAGAVTLYITKDIDELHPTA